MAYVLIRIVWFVLVGWWLGILWFVGSIALMASLVFFPFGLYRHKNLEGHDPE